MNKLKGILFSFILALIPFMMQAEVTKFLGIPVDGPKNEMITKLKAKGFSLKNQGDTEYLSGRFNGMDVHVYIQTEGGKVCRIMVCDENTMSAGAIINRFNILCNQFKNNDKYLSLDDYTIPNDENLSYEMTCHNKRYEAIFYQLPDEAETLAIQEQLQGQFLSKYTPEQLAEPTPDLQSELFSASAALLMESVRNRPVWFMISELYGKYYITMFYDNELNRANGDDL